VSLSVVRTSKRCKMLNKRAIRKVHPLLKIISSLGKEEQQVLLHYLTHEGCDGVYECVENGLRNTTFNPEDRQMMQQSLLPQKNKFKRLLKEQDPQKKKRALMQVGEGIGVILEKTVPLLGKYLQNE
jgi:hypothetical protein